MSVALHRILMMGMLHIAEDHEKRREGVIPAIIPVDRPRYDFPDRLSPDAQKIVDDARARKIANKLKTAERSRKAQS